MKARLLFPKIFRQPAGAVLLAAAMGLGFLVETALACEQDRHPKRASTKSTSPTRVVKPRAPQSPVDEGLWTTLPYEMPINPVHVGLLHTGKVVVIAGTEAGAVQTPVAAVWDPKAGTIIVQDLLWDIFCSGMAALPDGRFLVAGGTTNYNPFEGEYRASVFDPATESFVQVEDMAHGRFYATVTELGDGSVMTFAGTDEFGNTNNTVEIYKVGSGWSPQYVAPWTPLVYPRLHLLPNGKVFYSGALPTSHLFSPATKTWTDVATTVYRHKRKAGTSVLLPLRAQDGYKARVLLMGGQEPTFPMATETAEIIDFSVRSPVWRMIAPMSAPRVQMNAVILPTGKVLALGGSAINEDETTASLAADLFDPGTETWSPAGVATYPRLYHSVALLLPDATVWVAGSNPEFGVYEKQMEIYSPAYLFTTDDDGNVIPATRPVITSAPAEIGYKRTFSIETPDSADISSVVLVKLGSPTHAFDQEQRLIDLSFSESAPGTLTATAPPKGYIAPPGYYMLFIVNQAGVPSVAAFVHLSSTPTDQVPESTITSPATDVTIQAGQSVDFAGTATDPDGSVAAYSWIFPEGNPPSSSEPAPGPVIFDEPGTYVISMTVLDNLGVNNPSPPTRTITVQP